MLRNENGMPLIGVCLPSFLGKAGDNLVVMNSMAWKRMVSMPLSWMYWRSLSVNLNRERNLEFFRAVRAVVIWSVICGQRCYGPIRSASQQRTRHRNQPATWFMFAKGASVYKTQSLPIFGKASSGQASLQISTNVSNCSSTSRLNHRLSIPIITEKKSSVTLTPVKSHAGW